MRINKGDYIDSSEFTREECERFCEIAVECGHDRGEWMVWFKPSSITNKRLLGVYHDGVFWSIVGAIWHFKNNLTTQFREFLDKEKGMNKFTKDDLKDGMLVTMRNAFNWWVCGQKLLTDEQFFYNNKPQGKEFSLARIKDDLTHDATDECDIIRVTDRDGTVVFEHEEEPRELTIEEIAKAFNLPVERIRIKK